MDEIIAFEMQKYKNENKVKISIAIMQNFVHVKVVRQVSRSS